MFINCHESCQNNKLIKYTKYHENLYFDNQWSLVDTFMISVQLTNIFSNILSTLNMFINAYLAVLRFFKKIQIILLNGYPALMKIQLDSK